MKEATIVQRMNRTRILCVARATGVVVSMALVAGGPTSGCGDEGGDMSIGDVQPRAGATQGEQPVKISGANFRTDIGYTVYFGNKKATSVTILDPETILVTTPQRDEPGEVDVTIRADNGPAFKIANGYRYEDMGGGVVENIGEGAGSAEKGNLQY